jgi:hypothetical protein
MQHDWILCQRSGMAKQRNSRGRTWLALAGVILSLPAAAQLEASGGAGMEISGYYKNLLVRSETRVPPLQSYLVDLNRLRLKVNGQITPASTFEIQYDHEVYAGNYVRTPQFRAQRNAPDGSYWRLDRDYLDRSNLYARHRVYRAFVTWSGSDTDLRLGRQRIALGTGRFFSPLDRINPVQPTALERDERTGVDALMVERKTGPLGRISGIYAPQRGFPDTLAVHWQGNARGVDWSLLGGRIGGERMIGLDLATQLRDAGLRAEVSHTASGKGTASFSRALFGIDYAFQNTVTVTAEFYYNGAGARRRSDNHWTNLVAGRNQNPGRLYFGAYASHELTPLLKSANYFMVNLDDRSRFFSPTLTYSVRANLDLSLGAQWYGGAEDSEFGRQRPLVFAQMQYFF